MKKTNERLQSISQQLSKLSKLDSIEDKLERLESTVSDLKGRVETVHHKTRDFETSVNFVSAKYDEIAQQHADIDRMRDAVDAQKQIIDDMGQSLKAVQDQRDVLQETVLDLQCRSMKQNLVFTGLGGDDRTERVEDKLRCFIYNELRIEDHIEFGNVHRFGRFVHGKTVLLLRNSCTIMSKREVPRGVRRASVAEFLYA